MTDAKTTPRTDAHWESIKHRDFSDIALSMHEFARQLEREVAELRRDAERYRKKRDIDAGSYVKTPQYMNNEPRFRDALLAAWFASYDAAIDAALQDTQRSAR